MIAFTDVCYRHADAAEGPALRGVNLAFRPAEFVAVVGRAGSGKSTLLRLANGLSLPTRGAVSVEGHATGDSEGRCRARSLVGLIFGGTDDQLLAGPVEEEVAFGPASLGLPAGEVAARVSESLRAVGLEGRQDEDPLALPPLDKIRLLVAAMLALGAKYLVLDEYAAALPGPQRRQLSALLRALQHSRGVGIVLGGPRRDDLQSADRVVALAEGTVVYDGPAAALCADEALACRVGLIAGPGEREHCVVAGQSGERQPLMQVNWAGSDREREEGAALRTLSLWPGELVGLAATGIRPDEAALLMAGFGKPGANFSVVLDGQRAGREQVHRWVAYAKADDDAQRLGRTVWEDVSYGLAPVRKGQAEAALAAVGLDDPRLHERPPASLSSGERCRLAIAAALARAPRIVILVEPFVRLDDVGARDLAQRLRAWCRSGGRSALVLSCRRDEMAPLVDRTVFW